jgi:hypothetical protein
MMSTQVTRARDTPADRAGIKIEGDNKWVTIIQNASHDKSNKSAGKSS